MQAVIYVRNTVAILTDVHTGVIQLTFGIFSLKENVDTLYEYLRALASHQVNPFIVPSDNLHDI